MDIIYMPIWQNLGKSRSSLDFVQDELFLMDQVEGLGFDICSSPEHHFDMDYSACPDNFMPLSWLAGRTTTLRLSLGAVILPWNSPLRAAEKLAFLDHISNGRCIAGFGRGLSKMEYAHFGIPMEESRERFDEALPMVLEALRTGVIEGDGKYYPQAPSPIYPIPRPELADDFCSVGMSPDSAVVAGEIGARLNTFVTKPLDAMMPLFDKYIETFKAHHPDKTPHLNNTDFFLVRESGDEALELALVHTATYFRTVIRHYEMDGDHFAKTKGYGSYAEDAVVMQNVGLDAAAEGFVRCQMGVGSPRQILETFEERLRRLGPNQSISGSFLYGGLSRNQAYESLSLFAKDVIPEARALAADYGVSVAA